MPRYTTEKIVSRGSELVGEIIVPFRFSSRVSRVYRDPSAPVPVYFIDAPDYFTRPNYYGERDDVERFAFFCRAVVEFARTTRQRFDIIHLNDWMTGLVPVYLKVLYADDPAVSETRTVFTIHNMAFQGIFDADFLPHIGLPDWLNRTDDGLEFFGQVSTLKGGIAFSDAVSAVSPTYSREIQTPEYGERLDGLLRSRSRDLVGILNGVDYNDWNPATDHLIAANYSVSDLSGKRFCKLDLLRQFHLPEDLDRPVIASVSRLSEQKGLDLIMDVAVPILERGLAFIALGSGDERYERGLQSLRDAWPRQVGIYLGFSNELAHKIEAGADMFLMPSRFEPCGLNQMYSLRYGTVPLVRAVGGLDDTVQNFDPPTGNGNGFKFFDYAAPALLGKIDEALRVYSDAALWRRVILNGMQADYSWERSARQYLELFEGLTRRETAASA